MDPGVFDRVARIVGQSAPRRALLSLAGGLTWALALEDLAGSKKRKKKHRKKRKKKGNAQKPACTSANGGFAFVAEGKYKDKPLRLTHTEQPVANDGATGSRMAITLAGQPLLTIETSFTPAGLAMTISYGGAVSGIQRANWLNDGVTLTGDIDGRAIIPLPVAADPASVQFADGAPPPAVSIAPALQAAVEALLRKASASAESCAAGRVGALDKGKQKRKDHHDSRHRKVTSEDVNPLAQPGCIGLHAGCQAAMLSCMYYAVTGCIAAIFGYVPCAAVASAACFITAQICRRTVRHNPPCCPVQCGGDPVLDIWGEDPRCCNNGDTCLDPNDNRKGCCAEGFRSCHGVSCCADDQECEADGVCCQPGYSSCGGQCCPDGSCLEGSCCAPPSGVACGGTCCPPFTRSCCGNSCCDGDCVNNSICCRAPSEPCGNRCCPGGKCCNGVCCGAEESCQNNVCRPVCSPVTQTTCPNLPGYAQCCPKDTLCCPNGECCPNFAPVCCGSGCCRPGQECCPDNVCRSTCIR